VHRLQDFRQWYNCSVQTPKRAEPRLAIEKPINWSNFLTLSSVAVLVGTEIIGTAWAAGWALGGWFQLSDTFSRILEFIFIGCGLTALYYFMRQALKIEPIRG
jgi:hypothetical protein